VYRISLRAISSTRCDPEHTGAVDSGPPRSYGQRLIGAIPLTEILIVDDSRVMREMVIACLRGLPGLEFAQAASGLEAIERLSLTSYDAMVLDLNMPDIGGFEVIEFVRGQDKLRSLPILVVTTRGDESSRGKALEMGASAFMTKPFAPEAIASAVRDLLDGSRATP
jgi:two-component system chemotaxis response regulator CheY